MRYFFAIAISLIVCTITQASSASIITRAGVATDPIKYYFDLNSLLTKSVNHAVKVAITASNSERTAVRFDTVQLFSTTGEVLGRNVASETDALTSTAYTFRFENFGVAGEDLKNVAGVQVSFFDAGGDNPTGRVTVQGVTVSLDRSVGEECVVEDPALIVIPEKPMATIAGLQGARTVSRSGGGGEETQGGGGGCGGASPQGPCYAGTVGASDQWVDKNNALGAPDDIPTSAMFNTSFGVQPVILFSSFGFDIPLSATIDGIEVTMRRAQTEADENTRDFAANLMMGVTEVGSDYGFNWIWMPNFIYEDRSFGNGIGDLWGLPTGGWTPANINDSSFGFKLTLGADPLPLFAYNTANIDAIWIRIYYTDGGGSIYDSFSDLIRTFSRRIACLIRYTTSCTK